MIQAFVTPPAKKHGRLASLLKAAKAYIFIERRSQYVTLPWQ